MRWGTREYLHRKVLTVVESFLDEKDYITGRAFLLRRKGDLMMERREKRGIAFFLCVVLTAGMLFWQPVEQKTARASGVGAPQKGSTVAGYQSDPALPDILMRESYQAPEGAIIQTFDSVEAMRNTAGGLKNGDLIETKGYYTAGDGGGAVYQVEESAYPTDNGGTIINLPGNYRARLVSGNDTVSVLQFGALGDGVTDDYEALNNGFSSGFSRILLNGRTYLVNRPIWFKTSNVTVEGMGATITCNDSYDFSKAANQILIQNVTNVTFQHLRILDGVGKLHKMEQIQCMQVENLIFNYCTLEIPESVKDTDTDKRVACNLSYRTGWKNISTTHCEIINLSGYFAGGAVGYNDMYNFGGENAILSDNVIRYNGKDEVIAIFGNSVSSESYFSGRQSYIRNVTISHNEFYAPNSDHWERAWGFSIGYEDSREIDRIVYENNYFEVDSACGFGYFSCACTNSAFRYNEIHSAQKGGFFKSDTKEAEPVMENNRIFITPLIDRIVNGSMVSGKFRFMNNEVTVDGDISSLFTYGGSGENNIIQVHGDVNKAIGFQSGNMTGNQITVTGKLGAVFESYTMVMNSDLIWKGNVIEAPNAVSAGPLLLLNGLTMNGHVITMEENRIALPDVQKDAGMIYDDLQDEKPQEQKIVLKNNQFGAYKTVNHKVSVTRIGNTWTMSDGTVVQDQKEQTKEEEGKKEAEEEKPEPEKGQDTSAKGAIGIKGFSLNYNQIIGQEGQSCTLAAFYTPSNTTQTELVYQSNDPSVFTVNAQGVVSLLREGKGFLTVKAKENPDITVVIPVTVCSKEEFVKSFQLGSPGDVKGTSSGGKVTLFWTSISGAEGYEIYRYDGITGKKKVGETKSEGFGFYQDATAEAGMEYGYTVVGLVKTEEGTTMYSAESEKCTICMPTDKVSVSLKQVTLSKKKAAKTTTRSVTVKWTADQKADGYQVYVSTNGGKSYKKTKTVKVKEQNKQKKTLSCTYKSKKGKTVYVKVRTYKKGTEKTVYSGFSKVRKIKLK